MKKNVIFPINRRRFMAHAGAAAASFAVLKPHQIQGTEANSRVKIGLIGCGGRGQWITNLFATHGGFEVVAGADYFQDRLDSFAEKFNVPRGRLYPRLKGYKQLLAEAGVDAVVIQTPPYFHPEQAENAVKAGKHVYLAKPVAVDVAGCKSVEQSGKAATDKDLCFLADFQTRADPYFIEAIKRVHQGALGRQAFGESSYHAVMPFEDMRKYMKDDPGKPENRLRAWGVDRILSGDIITEQNIHTLDVASWIMNQAPLHAVGHCSHKVRGFGDCSDHFTVIYTYPDNVDVTFTSRQFDGHGTKPDGIRNRMHGTDGVLETQYAGQVLLRGKHFYRGGRSPGLYKEGAVTNIAAFHQAISNGDASNPTVAPSVRSNLLTILGRTAAYTGRKVTWQEMLQDTKILDPGLDLTT